MKMLIWFKAIEKEDFQYLVIRIWTRTLNTSISWIFGKRRKMNCMVQEDRRWKRIEWFVICSRMCHVTIQYRWFSSFQNDSYYFSIELTVDSREVGGELYCLRCHDTMGIPICGACHRPIEERVVTALGKNWHVEVFFGIFMNIFKIFPLQHFVCSVCEKPFLGHRHYERKGLAYCEHHYHKVCIIIDLNKFSWFWYRFIKVIVMSVSWNYGFPRI